MFPRYLQYLLPDFRQTFVTGASRDRDELITFWGQKVKVQGHTIAAEAHSTRRYRRVQLFLVVFILDVIIVFGLCVCFLVVSTSASDCLEGLVSEMTNYVSSGTLHATHSLT